MNVFLTLLLKQIEQIAFASAVAAGQQAATDLTNAVTTGVTRAAEHLHDQVASKLAEQEATREAEKG
ncbi:MAG: hypothetical protein V4501_08145 [Pseudomonadota bacterium]